MRFSVGYVSVGNNALTIPVSYTTYIHTYIQREMGNYDELLESKHIIRQHWLSSLRVMNKNKPLQSS